jgi:RimJ/RimL family protein N-acetyltransferase
MTELIRPSPPTVREGTNAIIKTPRLLLRAPRAEDAASIATIANDRRIAENTVRIPHPYTLADAQAFIAFVGGSDHDVAFVVTLPDGHIIGTCGMGSPGGKGPEIGYWLGVAYWNNGYATEAARAVVNHAFTAFRYDMLEAGARVSNPASRRVLEKCGFQWTGVALRRPRAIGSHVPVDRFRLDRSLWAAARSHGEVEHVA